MDVLKTWDIVADMEADSVNAEKLKQELLDSGHINNLGSLNPGGNKVVLIAESFNDEAGANSVVYNHDPADPVGDVKDTYKRKYRIDGQDYCDGITAALIVDHKIDPEALPISDIILIEAALDGVITKLERGHWITAQAEHASIVVAAPLTQTLYDQIGADIAAYVTANYS